MDLNKNELATILVALRMWQEYLEDNDSIPSPFTDYFSECDKVLSPTEIDELCEKINQ